MRGVGAVTRVGGATREVRVELDPARLLALNATAADISRQLRQTQRESSGGRTDVGGAEQSVRTIATVQSAAELAQMEIALSDGRRLRLDQVANVSDTVGEQRSAAFLNGKPVVGFEIVRTRGAGEVDVERGVRAALEALKKANPSITITEAFNFVDPVEQNYEGSMALLFEGAALAVLVVFLFLRNWRATLVATTALPLSIIPAFWVMSLLGFIAQRRDAARALADRRHPGRRRDRRDREHHASPRHGQEALRRRRWKRPTRSAWRSSPPPSR